MNHCKGKITKLLADYFRNDFRRITHALEVLKYAEQIKLNNGQAFNPGCEAKAPEDYFPGNRPRLFSVAFCPGDV